jgi:ADP-ribosyl-[dinitrogen reductase] hydrolase
VSNAGRPPQIDELALPGLPGVLGLTRCPGTAYSFARAGTGGRGLAEDIEAIYAWGAKTVITLVEYQELQWLEVLDLGRLVGEAGMRWLHLPIVDCSAPNRAFEEIWDSVRPGVMSRLGAGERICIHCRAGLGRTGLVAGMILVECGVSPSLAIEMVRKVRPGSIETTAQERYLLTQAHRRQKPGKAYLAVMPPGGGRE